MEDAFEDSKLVSNGLASPHQQGKKRETSLILVPSKFFSSDDGQE